VRLVDPDGEQLGIKLLPEALDIARQLDLDLVEVAPLANPPVCRIMDYGKFKFDAAQRAKESRRKAVHVGIKEMKYRPKIGPGDFDTKTRQVAKFLDEGHKVKITIMFRGREVFHPELGKKILDRIADQMDGMGKPESVPRLDGRNMVMVLAPDKRAKQSAASRGPRSSNSDKSADHAAPAKTTSEEASGTEASAAAATTPAPPAASTPATPAATPAASTPATPAATPAPAAAGSAPAAAGPDESTPTQPAPEVSETPPAPTETPQREEG
jgi:translation initiation factor IF-3